MQFIVELEGGNDSSVDLAGDAGVVGRWLVEGDDSNPELRMDLKGVVYAATTVSLPNGASPTVAKHLRSLRPALTFLGTNGMLNPLDNAAVTLECRCVAHNCPFCGRPQFTGSPSSLHWCS